MLAHPYIAEKLRQFDEERLSRVRWTERELPRSRPVLTAVILATGRALQRAGEGLEAWGTRPGDREEACC